MKRGQRRSRRIVHRTSRRVSLAFELDDLSNSLEGIHLLAQELTTGHLPDEGATKRTPQLIEALLALALVRLRQVIRVVYGHQSAGSIWTPYNDATDLKHPDLRGQIMLETGTGAEGD